MVVGYLWLSGPELIQPEIELEEARGRQGIDALRASRGRAHKAGIKQNLEVLGDRRPAHGKPACKTGDRTWLFDQQLEDRAPRRVAERIPEFRVSRH